MPDMDNHLAVEIIEEFDRGELQIKVNEFLGKIPEETVRDVKIINAGVGFMALVLYKVS